MYHIGCNRYCPNGIDPNDESALTRQVTLKFKRKELLYDIDNYSYIEGHVMGEDKQEAQHTLVDVTQEGNIDRVLRILAVVHDGAVEMLYPYTKTEIGEGETEEIDNTREEPDEYEIEMRVPKEMSRTTLKLLTKLVHEYMVYRVMHDWLCITNREAAQHWLDKAAEAEEEINAIKNLRTGVLTRPMRPL